MLLFALDLTKSQGAFSRLNDLLKLPSILIGTPRADLVVCHWLQMLQNDLMRGLFLLLLLLSEDLSAPYPGNRKLETVAHKQLCWEVMRHNGR